MKSLEHFFLLLSLLAALLPGKAAAEGPLVLNVWPATPPGEIGNIGPEHFLRVRPDGKPIPDVAGRPVKWLTNVSIPTLTIYRPPKNKDTGVSMLICPGGGLTVLAWDVEGEEVAHWLNSVGITGIILKYRVPRRPDQTEGKYRDTWYIRPLQDAQRALSLVRSRATEWGLDPQRIGIIGFSAGAGLATWTAANFEKRAYDALDTVDQISCRPDFAVVLYNGGSAHYSKERNTYELNDDSQLRAGGPPMFFVATGDDGDKAEIAAVLYLAAHKVGIPAELHLYMLGGHDFGLRPTHNPVSQWPTRCVEWLRSLGILHAARA